MFTLRLQQEVWFGFQGIKQNTFLTSHGNLLIVVETSWVKIYKINFCTETAAN